VPRPAQWSAALAVAVAALVGAYALTRGGDDRGEAGAAAPAPSAKTVAPVERTESGPRDAVVGTEAAAPDAHEAAAPKRTFRATGRAIGLDGAPLAGVALAAASDPLVPADAEAAPGVRAARGVTAANGAFDLELTRAADRICSADPGWTVVAGARFRHDGPPLELVIAPRTSWSARVVDAELGTPLEGALARAVAGPAPALEGRAEPLTVQATSDGDGRVALDGVVARPDTRLVITAPGRAAYVAEPGPVARDLGVIPLLPGQPPVARGVVALPDGSPAAGAQVSVGDAQTLAGPDGAFELAVPVPAPTADLVARLEPHAPVRAAGVGRDLLAGDVEGLAPRFGAPGLALEGRIVDGEGTPQKRWSVEALDPSGEPAGIARHTRKDGVFRIDGLGPGPHTLIARGRDRDELAVALAVEPPRVGLELRTGGAPRPVQGRAWTADDRPAVGATVELVSPGTTRSASWSARVDADGRFELAAVPDTAARLRIEPAPGDDGLATSAVFDPTLPGEIELRLAAARSLAFEASTPETAPDALFAVGADGRPRDLWLGGTARRALELPAGRSGWFRVPTDATVLVLARFGREVARVPIPAEGGLVRW